MNVRPALTWHGDAGTQPSLHAYAPEDLLQVDGGTSVEVHYDEMTFFTHRVNGQTYGAWYRQLAPRELEVMGAGFMCKTAYAGCDELSVARSVLEGFLQRQIQSGAHPRPLDGREQRDNHGDDTRR